MNDPIVIISARTAMGSFQGGFAGLATAKLGAVATKLQPDFDPRLYGFKKLSDLVKSKPHIFGVEGRPVASSNSKVVYVRRKAKH